MTLFVPVLAALAGCGSSHSPQIVVATVPAENATEVESRYQPLVDYLQRALGMKVVLRTATDYAAVIEGQRSGEIDVAQYGAVSYARARSSGAPIEPFAIAVGVDGSRGYHSVLWVRAGSSFRTVADLRGKVLCLVDPNSTSGDAMPRRALAAMGLDPEHFFSRINYAGSHENALIALHQSVCDGAFTWWNSDQMSALTVLAKKGLVRASDFRIIYKSPEVPNAAFAFRSNLPAPLRGKIRQAFLDLPREQPAAFKRLYDGAFIRWDPIGDKDYRLGFALNAFVDQARKDRK